MVAEDKGRADSSVHVGRDEGADFYFTNYFICLELFQLDLGPVSKRANTVALPVVVPRRSTPFRPPPEATFHGATATL